MSMEMQMQQEPEKKYTPTPWAIWEPPYGGPRKIIIRADGASIAEIEAGDPNVSDDENEANAAFIVRAVNNHDALVEALQACRADLSAAIDRLPPRLHDHEDMARCKALLSRINAALSAAQEHS